MQGILYDDFSVWIFVLVTLVMGGAAGLSTGKAIAQTWRPGWHLFVSALALGVAVRFIHFALFDASFLTPQYYVIDTLFVLLFGFVGFRLTRVKQMTARYRWLYEATSAFTWRSTASRTDGAHLT
jgi:hypothetical protein